jgi:hypothetical protein
MLSDVDCRSRAEQCLAQIAQQCGDDLVLVPSPFQTAITLAYTYQTAEYMTTRDVTHALAGNGPILVSKLTGAVEVAGTTFPIEDCVREFEARAARSA